jgi:hypothetical protein
MSPELALIDPELRRTASARLNGDEFVFGPARIRPIPLAPAPSVSTHSWPRRAVQTALLLGLLVAGMLVANVAARDTAEGPQLLTGSTTSGATSPAQAIPPPATGPQATTSLGERVAVEQELLDLIVHSPSKRLPPALIDPRTGLARNNLQAACHPAPPGYLCVIRPALHKPREGLIVRYGPNGFIWSRYRTE